MNSAGIARAQAERELRREAELNSTGTDWRHAAATAVSRLSLR